MANDSHSQTNRQDYFDGIKITAIFVVFATHFIAKFHEEYFTVLEKMPWGIIFGGVSGKLGVAFFGVILGYFAYRSSENNVFKYSIKRYTYFLICALCINFIFMVMGAIGVYSHTYSLRQVIHVSLTLSAKIYDTFWCIRPFFIASVLSRINGKGKLGVGGILVEIAIFLYWGKYWVAICIMGNIIAVMMDEEIAGKLFSHRFARFLIYALFMIAIKRPESNTTYLIYGICALLVIIAVNYGIYIKAFLELPFLSKNGRNTMAIYLIHVIVYDLLGVAIFRAFSGTNIPYIYVFIIAFIASWLCIVALSYPLTILINTISKKINAITEKMLGMAPIYLQ